ncbi:MAG: hypothetical protein ABUT20_29905, partial [Bacteroidota bacterium]
MKVRWREHEMIFATMFAAILLAGYLWDLHNTTVDQYAAPFINNHVPFNLYRNLVIPQIGAGVLIYLAYLFVNLFTIRRLLSPKKFEIGTSKIAVSFRKISLQG